MKLGMFGFGAFGQFMANILKEHFDVLVYNRSDKSTEAEKIGVTLTTMEDVASCPILLYAVPVQAFEETLIKSAPYINDSAIVMDVCSVKIKPIELMKKHVPPSAEIIGLHPLFGPQSGKNGISGLKVVTCKVRGGSFDCVSDFMRDKLMLDVCQKTPEEHDKQMAYVQALNHLIARALDRMNLPDCDLGTPAYERLKDVHRILQGDSMELFLTIERENPFAAEIRHSFCRQLDMLEAVIAEGELSDGK